MSRPRMWCIGDPAPPVHLNPVPHHKQAASKRKVDGFIPPMLAWKRPGNWSHERFLAHLEKNVLPCWGTPKIDGIRCLTQDDNILPYDHKCVAITRSLKLVPNHYIRERIGKECPPWLDGELVVGDTFTKSTSGIMSKHGTPHFTYWVFDCCINTNSALSYHKRADILRKIHEKGFLPEFVKPVLPVLIKTLDQLVKYEEDEVNRGAEGICIRPMYSPYLRRRATYMKPYLVAIKRFLDAEATVIGLTQLRHNDNPAEVNALGYQERSTNQENMIEMPMVGALVVKDVKTGVEFNVGTGLNNDMRTFWWEHQDQIIGKIVKYKYQDYGMLNKPRLPVFVGIRDERDMSEIMLTQHRSYLKTAEDEMANRLIINAKWLRKMGKEI